MAQSINGISKAAKVPRTSVYKWLSEDGIDLATLRDAGGNLTQGGAEIVLATIDHHRRAATERKDVQRQESMQGVNDASDAQNTAATLAVAQKEIEYLKRMLENAERERESVAAERDAWRDQAQRLLLPDGGGQTAPPIIYSQPAAPTPAEPVKDQTRRRGFRGLFRR